MESEHAQRSTESQPDSPADKESLVRFWRDGPDLVAPCRDATFTGRCLITGKGPATAAGGEFALLSAVWLPWRPPYFLRRLLSIGHLLHRIMGCRGSLLFRVDRTWADRRNLFFSAMVVCLLTGLFFLFIQVSNSLPAFVAANELLATLFLVPGPVLLAIFISGIFLGRRFLRSPRVVKASANFLWIRGAAPQALEPLPPWEKSPCAAAERPAPVMSRMTLQCGVELDSPFEEFEAPRRAGRAATVLALWGTISILGFLAVVPLVAIGGDLGPRDEWRFGVAFGFGFGVASLAALWTAFGPFRFFSRVPLAIVMVLLAMTALASFFLLAGINNGEGAILVAGAAGMQWLGLVILFAITRMMIGCKLAIRGTPPPVGNRAAQFGIGQILIWTTGVAIVLAALRLVVTNIIPDGINWNEILRESTAFGLLLGFNLVLTCSIAWALLSRGNLVIRLALGSFLILIATWLEYPAFSIVLGNGGDTTVFWWINGAGTICLTVKLAIVRLCGYRLVPSWR